LEEGVVYDTADGVNSAVIRAGLTAAGAVETGHWVAAADGKRLAQDVCAAVFWFDL